MTGREIDVVRNGQEFDIDVVRNFMGSGCTLVPDAKSMSHDMTINGRSITFSSSWHSVSVSILPILYSEWSHLGINEGSHCKNASSFIRCIIALMSTLQCG